MIILKDLLDRPGSPTAAASRTVIDSAFARCGPYGGIQADEGSTPPGLTEGGAEAWEFLRRLRTRAWCKAGLDPAFIWVGGKRIQAPLSGASAQENTEEGGEMVLGDGDWLRGDEMWTEGAGIDWAEWDRLMEGQMIVDTEMGGE